MAELRAARWIGVALAGCAVGIGTAWTVPALASQPAEKRAPQYKLVIGEFGQQARAYCPAGYTVTGGGYSGSGGATNSVPLGDLSGWYAQGSEGVRTWAVCVSNG
ncbi:MULTISPECIES: hypothetical protein [Streptomyces]|uniref:hypothetical protein n=1 Tax=Streptomyces TaxID=1883 RepID=UPI001670F149|nr:MULTISPECIES: hypothetical protein [Streptomyces]UFR06583.1 hypothetical protein KBP30_37820 [Streptomyces sp. Go40/10]GGS53519.1 hypothetical protein GCM10010206_13910 [Streptomyces cinerochromogenes]